MICSALRRLRYVYGSPPLDNFIYKLYYRWTVWLLVAFSFVITCKLFAGYSFTCKSQKDYFDLNYLNMRCYYNAVYTSPAKLVVDEGGSTATLDPTLKNYRRYQSYYPWVNLFFLVHAFNFYLPHLLWKSYEKGYMYRLIAGVQKYFEKEKKRGLELCCLAKYVLATRGKHKLYAAMYIFFEMCNFVISLAHTLWLVNFFNVTGVPDFLPYTLETWSNYKEFYFPTEVDCDAFTKGASGAKILIRTPCLLLLNDLYMKMFLFLHAWYILLTALCGLILVHRIALRISPYRIFMAKVSSPLSDRSVLVPLCRRLSYDDWFFLTRVQKAMTDVDFAHVVDKIAIASDGKDPSKEENTGFTLSEDETKILESSNATSPL